MLFVNGVDGIFYLFLISKRLFAIRGNHGNIATSRAGGRFIKG